MAPLFKSGDQVRLRELPPWVSELPVESQAVFRFCVGRTFPIEEVDQNGFLVLNVSREVDQPFGGVYSDIRVEPRWVEPA